MLCGDLVFLSLISLSFSQQLTQDFCEIVFGVQTVEYTCSVPGPILEWIVEPVVQDASNSLRFTSLSELNVGRPVGNIVAILDSNNPYTSRLRVKSDATVLNETNITCVGSLGNNPTPIIYVRNNYVPQNPLNIVDSANCTRTEDCITLTWIPPTSTDVDYSYITSSGGTVRVDASQDSVTICDIQDTVTIYFNTTYLCGYTSNSVPFPVDRCVMTPTTGRSIPGVGFLIWAAIATIIAIMFLVVVLVYLIALIYFKICGTKKERGSQKEIGRQMLPPETADPSPKNTIKQPGEAA